MSSFDPLGRDFAFGLDHLVSDLAKLQATLPGFRNDPILDEFADVHGFRPKELADANFGSYHHAALWLAENRFRRVMESANRIEPPKKAGGPIGLPKQILRGDIFTLPIGPQQIVKNWRLVREAPVRGNGIDTTGLPAKLKDESRLAERALAAGNGKKKRKRHGGGRKRQSSVDRKLTPKQVEAAQIVGECKGSIADAARRLGKNPKTIRQHYNAAMEKMGKTAVKHATHALPADRRGQANIAEGQDRRC